MTPAGKAFACRLRVWYHTVAMFIKPRPAFLDDYISHFRTEKKTGSISACQEQLSDKPTYTLSRILNEWKLSGRHIWLHLKPGNISFWTCTAAFVISQLRMMSLQVFLLLLLSQWAALFQGKCFYIVLKTVFLQLTIYQSMVFLRRDLERLVSKREIH